MSGVEGKKSQERQTCQDISESCRTSRRRRSFGGRGAPGGPGYRSRSPDRGQEVDRPRLGLIVHQLKIISRIWICCLDFNEVFDVFAWIETRICFFSLKFTTIETLSLGLDVWFTKFNSSYQYLLFSLKKVLTTKGLKLFLENILTNTTTCILFIFKYCKTSWFDRLNICCSNRKHVCGVNYSNAIHTSILWHSSGGS